MTIKSLLADAINELPAFKKEYDYLIDKDIIDKESGMHIVFGYVFAPLLDNALKSNDIPLIRQLCAFLETMAGCPDENVREVCDQSIIEYVCSYHKDDELLPYFGENTIKGVAAVREYIWEPE